MHVGIVADTHDDTDLVAAAIEQFEAVGVDAVVHCGDFVAPFSAAPFENEAFDFYAVRGNNDGEWGLQPQIDEFGTYLGEMGELTLDGVEVAVYHGTSGAIVDALVECGNYDYVLHGHTHERVLEEHEGTVRINPGGIPIEAAPEPPHVAVLDTESGEIEFTRL
jgi:putative phosphoesterase